MIAIIDAHVGSSISGNQLIMLQDTMSALSETQATAADLIECEDDCTTSSVPICLYCCRGDRLYVRALGVHIYISPSAR